tara:strand:+ start:1451 stop:1666 length:216 start_codon:yes stop_codon:yes gene_type:complete
MGAGFTPLANGWLLSASDGHGKASGVAWCFVRNEDGTSKFYSACSPSHCRSINTVIHAYEFWQLIQLPKKS